MDRFEESETAVDAIARLPMAAMRDADGPGRCMDCKGPTESKEHALCPSCEYACEVDAEGFAS